MHLVRWILLGFFLWSPSVQCEENAPDLILPPPEAMAPEGALPSNDPPSETPGASEAPLPPKKSEEKPKPPAPPPLPKNRTLIYGSQTYADCVEPSPWNIETLP